MSAVKVSSEFNEKFSISISPKTVRILREAGLHGCSAFKKFFVSVKKRKFRLSFAKSMINKSKTYWNNVLFADKSKFNIFGPNDRITVCRRKNEELHSKNLVGTVKHGRGGVILWGCMSSLGFGNFVFIDDIMNHSLYLNILRDNFN